MTEKQAAVPISLSSIIQAKFGSASPLSKLLDEVTREMCVELNELDVPTSHVFDLLSKHGL